MADEKLLKNATRNEKLYAKLSKTAKEQYTFPEFVKLREYEKAVLRSDPEGRDVEIPKESQKRSRNVKEPPKKGNPGAVIKKAGGKVMMKNGGSVKKCKRDGIAKRGKTRCKGTK